MKSLPMVSGGNGPRFARHTGKVAPLLQNAMVADPVLPIELDADRDPASAPRAFDNLRRVPRRSEDPAMILDQERFRGASILVAGENFGDGGQPESDVSRLMSSGIRSVIAPSFGAEFYDTCFVFGLLAVSLDAEVFEELAGRIRSDPEAEMTVDLEKEEIELSDMEAVSFEIDPRRRRKLLLGLTDLDEMRQHRVNARTLRHMDRSRRPWIYTPPTPDHR